MDIISILIGLAAVAGIFGLVTVIAIIFLIVYGVRRVVYALKGNTYVPLLKSGKGGKTGGRPEYEHQDVKAGSNAESIAAILKRYQHTEGVGRHARAGLSTLDSCDRKVASFTAVLDSKFMRNSLSWEKFAVASDSAQQAVLSRCARLANQIQTFDVSDYREVQREYRVATFKREQVSPTTAQKRQLFQESLAEMEEIIAEADGFLFELDKLTAELGKLDTGEADAQSERLVEEIRRLIDETKYYQQ